MSKAEQVRQMVAACKAEHEAPTEELIKGIMETFGFKRQLARAYIKNNWDRPEKTSKAKVTAGLTFEQALEQIPLREKGRFIARTVREERARALMAA